MTTADWIFFVSAYIINRCQLTNATRVGRGVANFTLACNTAIINHAVHGSCVTVVTPSWTFINICRIRMHANIPISMACPGQVEH